MRQKRRVRPGGGGFSTFSNSKRWPRFHTLHYPQNPGSGEDELWLGAVRNRWTGGTNPRGLVWDCVAVGEFDSDEEQVGVPFKNAPRHRQIFDAGCEGLPPGTDLSASRGRLGVKYPRISANFWQTKESVHRYDDSEAHRNSTRIFGVHPRIRIVAFKVSGIRRSISVDWRDRRFKWATTQGDRDLEMQRMAARSCPGMRTCFQSRVARPEGRCRLMSGKA